MADVFISYSRKDKGFVRRLDEALKSRKREAWIDWEGIRPTEEFMQAIYAAIEAADTFIFVLTPDSITSAVCRREIAHAAEHNKRMVPIVQREVDTANVPEALAKLNWIFCRDGDDFEKAADTLIQALDTDLEWVRAHTRLLMRAIEWETKGKNNSFVLRGVDLRAAEQWLTKAGAVKERQPTPLQTDYIIASRKAAARRQRITLGAVTVGALVAIVLAIVAWSQRTEALSQRKVAIEKADEAERKTREVIQTLSRSHFLRAEELWKSGNSRQAIAYLAQAARIDKENQVAASLLLSLADPSTRTVSPLSNLAVAEWIENIINDGTLDDLRVAIQVDPSDPRLAAHFGRALADQALKQETGAGDARRLRSVADFQTRRALKLAPDNEEVKKLRAEIVRLLGIGPAVSVLPDYTPTTPGPMEASASTVSTPTHERPAEENIAAQIADADAALGVAYTRLRDHLGRAEQDALKMEERKWIKWKDGLPGNSEELLKAIQDRTQLLQKRLEEK
jgi:tetratricopeptide (TPR) repeat protein